MKSYGVTIQTKPLWRTFGIVIIHFLFIFYKNFLFIFYKNIFLEGIGGEN